MRFAILENDRVVNIIHSDRDFIDTHYPGAIDVTDTYCGIGWLYQNGVFVDDSIIAPIPNLSLTEAIDLRLAEVTEIAKQIQDKAIEQYSLGEISTWNRKEADARSILTGKSAPLLEHEAAIGGIPVQALAAVIVRKADEYRMFSATVVGVRSRHQQAISVLQTVEEVMTYVVDGWPSL